MYRHDDACPRMLQYRPPRIAITLLVVAAAAQLLLPAPWLRLPASSSTGIALALLGLGVMLRAWWLFRRYDTAICPTAVTTRLITGDVYRLTRNPMYLGIVLMLLGLAVGTGGAFFYVAALAFFLIIDAVFCPFEEAKLRRDFGVRFADYQQEVRRWL